MIVMEFFDGAVEISEAEVTTRSSTRGSSWCEALGRRARAPRHQAGQPDGPRRPREADRRVLRAGAALPVAPGGRPGEHDARPRRSRTDRRSTTRRSSGSPPTRSPRRSPRRGGWRAPSQLRAQMKTDERDLVREFRDLAPERAPVPDPALEPAAGGAHIDRGTRSRPHGPAHRGELGGVRVNRPAVTALFLALAATTLAACTVDVEPAPDCTEPGDATVILLAQAVPTATVVPCSAPCRRGGRSPAVATRDGEGSLLAAVVRAGPASSNSCSPSCAPGDAPEVLPRPEESARACSTPQPPDPLDGGATWSSRAGARPHVHVPARRCRPPWRSRPTPPSTSCRAPTWWPGGGSRRAVALRRRGAPLRGRVSHSADEPLRRHRRALAWAVLLLAWAAAAAMVGRHPTELAPLTTFPVRSARSTRRSSVRCTTLRVVPFTWLARAPERPRRRARHDPAAVARIACLAAAAALAAARGVRAHLAAAEIVAPEVEAWFHRGRPPGALVDTSGVLVPVRARASGVAATTVALVLASFPRGRGDGGGSGSPSRTRS